jgi:3'-5' exonuclease
MLQHISLQTVLCLDIETVPQYPDYSNLPSESQKQWMRKAEFLKRKAEEQNETLYERAGIYAEFGKIICISAGYLSVKSGDRKFHLQSFYGDDEKEVLLCFISFLKEFNDDIILCAHNGKEFDFPYLCRRMLIQSIKIPAPLQISGKKPWEVNHLDTMELWKFGDYKHYTPLNLLASIFNIANPKDDIDGSQVGQVYWKEHDLVRIEKYCIKDVVTVMQILLRMKGEAVLEEEEIYVHEIA